MTDDKSIHDFNKQVDCIYEKERYSVRDNGAVLKNPLVGLGEQIDRLVYQLYGLSEEEIQQTENAVK